MRNFAWCFSGAAGLAVAVAAPAFTQDTQSQPTTDAPTGGAQDGTSDTASAPAAPPTRASYSVTDVTKFAAFDALKPQGQTSDVPGTYDTVLRDAGGFRSWLFDNGFYFRGQNATSLAYDVAGGRSPTSPQAFDGQKLTVTNTLEGRISKKIDGSGDDIGQINVSLAYTRASWDQVGPNSLSFYRLDLYQSFLNRKIELTAGVGANIVNYIGIFSGGNLLLANGLAATIPLEVGLSGGSATTPLVNVQLNGANGLYSKTGIQRSTGPLGAIDDAKHSDHGLDLTRPGARALYIQEFGLLRQASADQRQIWLRAGAIYNPTLYTRIDGKGRETNWAAYVLADYQIVQPDKSAPYRGVFLGGSALVAPGSVNVFKQTYEARVYAVGMFLGRPADAINFTIDYNRFSRSGGDFIAQSGVLTHQSQLSAGVLYAFTVSHGIYLQPSATYIHNPSFTGDFKRAVNLATSLTFLI